MINQFLSGPKARRRAFALSLDYGLRKTVLNRQLAVPVTLKALGIAISG
jgi:hypothetical protein